MTRRPLSDSAIARILNDAGLGDLVPSMIAAGKRIAGPGTERDGLGAQDYQGHRPGTCNCTEHDACPHGTPTERAALSRQEQDPQSVGYWQAIDAAQEVIRQKRIAYAGMDRILAAVNTADLNPEPGCEVMSRVGVFECVHRRTEIDGKTWALGKWAYDFHRRVARLPTKAEAEKHARGERIRLPA